MGIDLGLLFLGLLTLFITVMLTDFKRLMRSNLCKLDPKYMNDTNTVKGTKLELDKEGKTIIIPTKRYSFNRYINIKNSVGFSLD